ncbi:hypothetical protein QR680_002287 [Steinernema hermaphroditum]|uniref:Uncharacterized protein n=1 Tax=Steinernema hermaphroditum TaxID=289476 RepID=A0AA39H499_9BILA|nr:hypothetical protein QR680_002287 [Steinernema hermaphroditum]
MHTTAVIGRPSPTPLVSPSSTALAIHIAGDLLSDSVADPKDDPQAVIERATVFVGALIGQGHDELGEKRAVGDGKFHAIKA